MVSINLPNPSKLSSNYQNETIETTTLDISGMKCAGCVSAVERQLSQQQGVISAQVNLITSVASVKYKQNEIKPETLAQKLTWGGFPSTVRIADDHINQNWQTIQQKKRDTEKQAQNYYLISSATLLFFSSIGHLHHWGFPHLPIASNIWFHWALATLALLIPGREILLNGWQGLWHKSANMNSLVGIGTVVAYLTSCLALIFPEWGWECFFDEPVMLLGFIFLGRVLEARARNRAEDSLIALLNFRPQIARLIGKNHPHEDLGLEIPANQVKKQEWVKVLEGEQFPVDGTIVDGETTVDESMLTGESVPIFKTIGDDISAGTVNISGVIILETVNSGENTKLSQIIKLVETAQTRKAPVQKLADTISGYFCYGIMLISLLTFTFWYGWGFHIWQEILLKLNTSSLILSLKLAIDVLVIACPCALGLATPTAILVGTSMGAENGLLIRGGDVLEQAKDLDTIIFDKTGTLTYGKPQVTDIISIMVSHHELIQIAASLEKNANHPLANGIITEAQKLAITLLPTESVINIAGKGIKGIVKLNSSDDSATFYLGNELWLTENQIYIEPQIKQKVAQLQSQGKTVIYVAKSVDLIGAIALSDIIRDGASLTVKKLKEMGLDVMMMSGDQPQVVQLIANQLQINSSYGGIQPQEKASLIQDLQAQNKVVAIVGDGVNDAPAMAVADLPIAMPQGSEIAIQTAKIILTRGNLGDVVKAIRLSRVTLEKIKQNLFWALGYNVIAIPIASGWLLPKYQILLNPATAGAFMAFSSVVVVTNSLLLKRKLL